MLAGVAAIVGLSQRDDRSDVFGPKFLTLQKVGRFDQPVHLSQPPGVDSPLFVVERPGEVKVIDDGKVQRKPFLDIRRSVKISGKGGEQGMLSIAFPPDYAASGLFYVAYTDNRDALRVAEFARKPGNDLRAERKSERLVLRIPQPTPKHHGGLLLFGPDKQLYIGSGDGGPSTDPNNVGQDKRVLLGKILRIDPTPPAVAPPAPKAPPKKAKPKKPSASRAKAKKVRVKPPKAVEKQRKKDEPAGKKGGGSAKPPKKGGKKREPRPTSYTIPPDNPLVGRPGRDEIFAYGLRNPWRFSFDRGPRGDLLTVGDVGDASYEEVNILPLAKANGANFGWSAFEGPVRFKPGGVKQSRTVEPVYSYPHNPRCSIVGGYIIRDPRLSRIQGREVIGRYIFGDFCSQRLFAFTPQVDKVGRERSFRFKIPGVTSFAEDREGRIYVLTFQGNIYRLDPDRKKIDSED